MAFFIYGIISYLSNEIVIAGVINERKITINPIFGNNCITAKLLTNFLFLFKGTRQTKYRKDFLFDHYENSLSTI